MILFIQFFKFFDYILFTDCKKSVFAEVKFDSGSELKLARIMDSDKDIIQWLRPSEKEFDLRYSLNGEEHNYAPDFIADTEKIIYMIEVKGEDRKNNPDVPEKEKAGINFCELASRWGIDNGFKEWRYLFIPDGKIKSNFSFNYIAGIYEAGRN